MLADLLANYLYVVRYLVILLMLLLLFFAIDDLFVDLYYWTSRLSRYLRFYRNHKKYLFYDRNFVYHTPHSLIGIALDSTRSGEKSDAAKFCG